MHAVLADSVRAHPRLWLVLTALSPAVFLSPLALRVVSHAAVLFAAALAFALWAALSDAFHHRSEIGRLRDGAAFFASDADARAVAASGGVPQKQFPLCSPVRWAPVLAARRREAALPAQPAAADRIQARINTIVALVVRSFVLPWYFGPISSEPVVPLRIEHALHAALAELRIRIARTNLVQFAIARIAPLVTAHVREFRRAEYILRAERIQRQTLEGDEFDAQIVRYYLSGNLHQAVSASASHNPDLERTHLRNRLRTIIPLIFPKSETGSRIVSILVLEILVCKIMQPIIDMLSDPDYWNQTFDGIAESIIQQEQSLGRRFDDAFDRDFAATSFENDGLDFAFVGSQSRPPSFDELLRQIKTCDSLPEALRIRDAISSELIRRRNETSGLDGDEIINGARVSKIRVFINRLQVAQKRADKRISALGGGKVKKQRSNSLGNTAAFVANLGQNIANLNTIGLVATSNSVSGNSTGPNTAEMEETNLEIPSLATILEDQHMLPFFTEYMEIANRLRYVQLWAQASVFLVQLGIIDSLNLQELDDAFDLIPSMVDDWDMRAISEDICRIYTEFFAPESPSFITDITPATQQAFQNLVEGLLTENEDEARYILVTKGDFRLLHQALTEVFQAMERDDYPGFLNSTIYTRMVEQLTSDMASNFANGSQKTGLPVNNSSLRSSRTEDYAARSGLPMTDMRISQETDRSSFEGNPIGNYDINFFDDTHRKSRGFALIGNMFKSKKLFMNRNTLHYTNNDGGDDPSSNAPVRIEMTPNFEGELNAIVNSDENSFVSFLRKKNPRRQTASQGATDDRNMRSRDDLNAHNDPRDAIGGSTDALNANDAAAETDDVRPISGGSRFAAGLNNMGEDAKKMFSLGNFRRRSRQNDKLTNADSLLPPRPTHGDTPSRSPVRDIQMDSRRRSNSLDGGKELPKFFVTQTSFDASNVSAPRRSIGEVAPDGTPLRNAFASVSTPSSPPGGVSAIPKLASHVRHASGNSAVLAIGGNNSGAASNSNGGTANNGNSLLPSSRNSTTTKNSVVDNASNLKPPTHPQRAASPLASPPANLSESASRTQSPSSPPQQQSSSQLPVPSALQTLQTTKTPLQTQQGMVAKETIDSTPLSSNMLMNASSQGDAIRSPEIDPIVRSGGITGEDDDDETQQAFMGSIDLSGVPRSRHEILSKYQNDQDILPPMIVMPKQILVINEEMAKLRVELDDVERQREAIEQSFLRGGQNNVSAEEEVENQRRIKQLRFMRIGIDEEHKRLVTEKRRLEFDELENVIMPDRAVISIGDSQVASDDGRDYAVYPVQVQRINVDGAVSGWIVMRRYSEFLSMHHALRAKHPAIVGQYEMPGKLLGGIIKIKKQSLELRRAALERYLLNLLRHSEICRSVEFRKFLCHPDISRLLFVSNVGVGEQTSGKKSFFKNIIQSVDEGFDSFRQKLKPLQSLPQFHVHHRSQMASDSVLMGSVYASSPHSGGLQTASSGMHAGLPYPFSAGSPNANFQPLAVASAGSLPLQMSAMSDVHSPEFSPLPPPIPSPGTASALGMLNANASSVAYMNDNASIAQVLVTDVMVDLFIELFELKERNNWLRRQAVVIILQQLFGGTVERRVTETLRTTLSEETVVQMLDRLQTTFWPDGSAWAPSFADRSEDARRRTRAEAQGKLAALLPELLGGMVGKHNARRGAVRWCSAFQSRRLNQHLVHVVLDELLTMLFPELLAPTAARHM